VDQGGEDDLAGAQGKLVVFLASLLQRAGVVPASEFADLLEIFASSVAETQPSEGAILAGWATAARQLILN
jgi:hypothetical protein